MKIKVRPVVTVPATYVRSLTARIACILNSKEHSNSQKIAMMRIANQQLAEEAA